MVDPYNRNKLKYSYVILDFFAASVSWCLAKILLVIRYYDTSLQFHYEIIIESLLIGMGWIILYLLKDFYVDIVHKSRTKELVNLLLISLVGVPMIYGLQHYLSLEYIDYDFFLRFLIIYFLIHFGIAASTKVMLMNHTKSLIHEQTVTFPTLIVGSGKNAKKIYQELESLKKEIAWQPVGFVDVKHHNSNLIPLPHLGNYKKLDDIINYYNIEEVVIAVDKDEERAIQEVLDLTQICNVKTHIIPKIYNHLVGPVKIRYNFSVPLIEIKKELMPSWERKVKRFLDIAVSFSVLLLGLPFLLIIGLVTVLTSKGPMLYVQNRIGENGKTFKLYKFRSMIPNAEKNGTALSSKDDPRVTRWGRIMRRSRMDELPQFWNVLRGDMSLVGPRPERDYYLQKLNKLAPHFKYRLKVRPGITSLAQVKFGYAENLDEMVERLKYDIFYIRNMSLILDLRIIMFTIITIIRGRGQ